jgi:hypothetical protein
MEILLFVYGLITAILLLHLLLEVDDGRFPPGLWWSWPIVCLALAARWLTCQILNGLWLIWCCVVGKAT